MPTAPPLPRPRAPRGRLLLASAFGLGLSPVLPGTCAALLGLGWHALLDAFLPTAGVAAGLAGGLALSAWLNHVLTPWAVAHFGSEDPSGFVWDEVAGYLLTALLTCWLPFAPAAPLGFVLFRALDMVKVWPASWIDRAWHGATGILVDDLVSATYAAGLVHAAFALGWVGG